jgi:hypothetical protein
MVDWASRNVRVDTTGAHLYDGKYDDVSIAPELVNRESGQTKGVS